MHASSRRLLKSPSHKSQSHLPAKTTKKQPLKPQLKRSIKTKPQSSPLAHPAPRSSLSSAPNLPLSTFHPQIPHLTTSAAFKRSPHVPVRHFAAKKKSLSSDTETALISPSPGEHTSALTNPAFNPLSTQLGHEHYNFESKTELVSSYQPDPTSTTYTPFSISKIPDDADALDIITALQKDQQLELEKDLQGVTDEHQRSFIIYRSAITLQTRLTKMRNLRKEKQKAIVEQCRSALDQMQKLRSTLSLLDTISLLRGLSVGDPKIELYTLDHVSDLQNFMLFFTARNQHHAALVAQSLQEYVESHPQFSSATPVNPHSARATAIQTMSGANLPVAKTNTDFGRKRGELLIFSRSDLQWRMLDLGTILVHISYGSERQFTDIESVLRPYRIDLDSPHVASVLSDIKVTKCLEITPISQLQEGKQ